MTNRPRIYVLAGVNGAGKSSIGGAAFRHRGIDYYNPDEAARELREKHPELTSTESNAFAWQKGREMLERAIREQRDFVFETTLGGNTIPRLLGEAAKSGIEVSVWYVGLKSPELLVFDNSEQAEPEDGRPIPRLVLHLEAGRILGPEDLSQTPDWAKPIVAAALQARAS